MAEDDTAYDPTTVQVDRARMQGLGVGATDLARQREPADGATPEPACVRDADDAAAAGEGHDLLQAGPPGEADAAYDGRDADEVSLTQPSGGAGG